MRLQGLAPLPMRLNTFKRVKEDTEYQRIRKNKHGKIYEFAPIDAKVSGSALGTIYKRTYTTKKSSLPKKWIGKVGTFAGVYGSRIGSSSSYEIKTER